MSPVIDHGNGGSRIEFYGVHGNMNGNMTLDLLRRLCNRVSDGAKCMKSKSPQLAIGN